MNTSVRRHARRTLVLAVIAAILAVGCYAALAMSHSPRLNAASPSPSTSPAVAPTWLQTIALGALQSSTSPSTSASVSVHWVLTTWGQLGQAVPLAAADPSLAAEPVYAIILTGPVTCPAISIAPGQQQPVGKALVLSIDPTSQHTVSQALLVNPPDVSSLPPMNTLAD